MPSLGPLWVYLHSTPLLGLVSTLLVYLAAQAVSARFGHPALLNPILVAIIVLVVLLLATRTSYAEYFQGAQYVHFLLGPATVALAIPMHANYQAMRRAARAVVPAVLAGSIAASASAMLIARLLGAPRLIALSLAPKSVTTPVAMGIAEKIGGQPSLAAAFVLLTGMSGVAMMGLLLRGLNWPARGLAGGTAAHGMATAQILRQSQTGGAFGGLAIGLNALLTALLAPILARLLLP